MDEGNPPKRLPYASGWLRSRYFAPSDWLPSNFKNFFFFSDYVDGGYVCHVPAVLPKIIRPKEKLCWHTTTKIAAVGRRRTTPTKYGTNEHKTEKRNFCCAPKQTTSPPLLFFWEMTVSHNTTPSHC